MASHVTAAENEVWCCSPFRSETGISFRKVQRRLRQGRASWHQSHCCYALRGLGAPAVFILAVLLLVATDCDIGATRVAAGSLLIFITVTDPTLCIVLRTVSTALEVALLPLLMVVAVSAFTWLPSTCNKHAGTSLEVAGAASTLASLVVHFYLAFNCKTNALWHRCSIAISPSESSRPPQQQQEAAPETMDKRLLCLTCDVPQAGSVLGRQALVTMSLSWLQVLLSLLGWLLLLAGCLLLNSNFDSSSPLAAAAGAFTVITAILCLIGGWTGFLGETMIFSRENQPGRRRLDKAVLALTTLLLVLGIISLNLLVAVVTVVWGQEAPTPALTHARRQTEGAACLALVLLLPLLLLAFRNNAALCRCHNFHCDNACCVCGAVMDDPGHSPALDSSPPPRHGQPRTSAPHRAGAATTFGTSVQPEVYPPRPHAGAFPTAPPPSPPSAGPAPWVEGPLPPPQHPLSGRPPTPPPPYSEVVGRP